MDNPSYEQIKDFAKKTADLSIKKLGLQESESDHLYDIVLTTLDYLCDYPTIKKQ